MGKHEPETSRGHLREFRRRGRWGNDDQLGGVNLLTPPRFLAAIEEAQTGEAVSLSRDNFLPVVAPLALAGGIGSPTNQLAVL